MEVFKRYKIIVYFLISSILGLICYLFMEILVKYIFPGIFFCFPILLSFIFAHCFSWLEIKPDLIFIISFILYFILIFIIEKKINKISSNLYYKIVALFGVIIGVNLISYFLMGYFIDLPEIISKIFATLGNKQKF